MEGLAPILEKFRITPASTPAVILFLFLSLIILLIFIGFELYRSRKLKQLRLNESWQWFFNYCESLDLSIEEVDYLKLLTRKYSPKNPFKLLASKYSLDEILFKEYETAPEDEKDDILELVQEIRRKLKLTHLIKEDIIRSTKEIEIGHILKVIIKKDEKREIIYGTLIENNDILKIQIENKKDIDLLEEYEDKKIKVNFWHTSHAGFSFKTTLLEIKTRSIILEHSEKLDQFQRRHYFRINAHLKGKYYPLTGEQKEKFEKEHEFVLSRENFPRNMRIINISGGGISISVTEKLIVFYPVWLKFNLDNIIQVKGIIGRIIREKKIRKSRYKYVILFEKIDESDREKIIQFIYKKQRNLLKF